MPVLNLPQILQNQLNKEIAINSLFSQVSNYNVFDWSLAGNYFTLYNYINTGYYSGSYNSGSYLNLTLTSNSTNYVQMSAKTGSLINRTDKFIDGCIRIIQVTLDATNNQSNLIDYTNSYIYMPYNSMPFSVIANKNYHFGDVIFNSDANLLAVQIIGGAYNYSYDLTGTAANTNLTLVDNSVNYIYLDVDNIIKLSSNLPTQGFLLHIITLTNSSVTDSQDLRQNFSQVRNNETFTTTTISAQTLYTYTPTLPGNYTYKAILVCKSASNGYSVGDEISEWQTTCGATNAGCYPVSFDGTNVRVAIGDYLYTVQAITGRTALTIANFSLKLKCKQIS